MGRTNKRMPYIFLAPFLIFFLMFFIAPFLYALFLSFFRSMGAHRTFVGLQNYLMVFKDAGFWSGLFRVFCFGIIQVVIMLILALGISLILDSSFVKGKSVFRLIYFLPYAVPGVIAAIMWGFLYAPSLDPLLTVAGHTLNILTFSRILYGIINIATWEWTGYNMTIYYANLTSIPIELYDAAKIDGCNELQTAIYIKVPMIRTTIIFTTVLTIIFSLQLFNEPLVLNSLMTLSYSYTPNMEIFNMAFSFGNLSYAAALSVILTIVTFAACMLFMFVTSDKRENSKRSEAK
jgi:multiple sugar transport system permease protein